MTAYLLDIGSTSIKFARYDPEKCKRYADESIRFPDALDRPKPFYEVDCLKILEIVRSILASVAEGDQIWMSVQMHGYVLCDRNGQAVTPYISWRDQRSLLMEEDKRYPFDLPKSRGVGKKPNLPLAGLYVMKAHMPKILETAEMFCTLGSYLAMQLTGRNCSHITDLAPTGMYDARTGGRYITPFKLMYPTAWSNKSSLGTYKGAQVFAPVGDQQASVAGSGLKKDQYLLNLGTAAQICLLSDQPVYGEFESRPYFNGKTLCTVTGLIGGRSFSELEKEKNAEPLVKSYGDAIGLLPGRTSIRAVGGACRYHRELVEMALNQIGRPWEIVDGTDALDGLIYLVHRRGDDQ